LKLFSLDSAFLGKILKAYLFADVLFHNRGLKEIILQSFNFLLSAKLLFVLNYLIPWVDFINILRGCFSYKSTSRSFSRKTFWHCDFLANGYWQMLMKLTPSYPFPVRNKNVGIFSV